MIFDSLPDRTLTLDEASDLRQHDGVVKLASSETASAPGIDRREVDGLLLLFETGRFVQVLYGEDGWSVGATHQDVPEGQFEEIVAGVARESDASLSERGRGGRERDLDQREVNR